MQEKEKNEKEFDKQESFIVLFKEKIETRGKYA